MVSPLLRLLRHGLMSAEKSLMRSCNFMTPASSFYYYDPTPVAAILFCFCCRDRARLLAGLVIDNALLFLSHNMMLLLTHPWRRCHSHPFHQPPTPPIRAEQATSSDGAFHPAIYPATCSLSKALCSIRIMLARCRSLSRHHLLTIRLVRMIPNHSLPSSHPSKAQGPDINSTYLHLACRLLHRPTPTPVLCIAMHIPISILSHHRLAVKRILLRSFAPIVAGHGC